MQAASDRVAREAIECLNAYGKTNGTTPFADATSDTDKDANVGLLSGLLPTSAPDSGAGVWPSSCTHFSEIYWNSWQQVVNYSVSSSNTTAWNAPGSLTIPGRTGTYKVTLQISVNGADRWYGIQ